MTSGSTPEVPESRNPDPENPDFPDFFFLLLRSSLDLRVDPDPDPPKVVRVVRAVKVVRLVRVVRVV